MTTIIIKKDNKQSRAIIEMLKAFSFVEVHEDEKSPYNPEFVEKIKRAEKEKGKVMTNAKDLWENIK
jgi:hypothetical protein